MYMNSPIGFYHQRFATWQLALPIPMKIKTKFHQCVK